MIFNKFFLIILATYIISYSSDLQSACMMFIAENTYHDSSYYNYKSEPNVEDLFPGQGNYTSWQCGQYILAKIVKDVKEKQSEREETGKADDSKENN